MSCHECGYDGKLPWEEDLRAYDYAVDKIACETVGHAVQQYGTGGLRCKRCFRNLAKSAEDIEWERQYERDTAGMSRWQKASYLQARHINLLYTRPVHNFVITDLTDQALSPEPT